MDIGDIVNLWLSTDTQYRHLPNENCVCRKKSLLLTFWLSQANRENKSYDGAPPFLLCGSRIGLVKVFRMKTFLFCFRFEAD